MIMYKNSIKIVQTLGSRKRRGRRKGAYPSSRISTSPRDSGASARIFLLGSGVVALIYEFNREESDEF
jgi:hypothetical protein